MRGNVFTESITITRDLFAVANLLAINLNTAYAIKISNYIIVHFDKLTVNHQRYALTCGLLLFG